MYTENDYLMWLSCFITFLDISKLNFLLSKFGSAENVYKAKTEEIRKLINIRESTLHKIDISKTDELMEKRLLKLQRKNIKFIGISNELYPDSLKEIQQPPIGLYVLGQLPDNNQKCVSIVGARRCSQYGENVAFKFAKELASFNIVIVSGMAEGIDGIAHKGSIDGNGKTIAVLGNGVDVCYPEGHRSLKEQIQKNGCIISEYPPGTEPKAYHFPQRNRIISGLSDATVVIEATEKSGTLITVGQALEQGKDVFAVPGNITSDRSFGTNELLKQGAYVLTKTKDILDVLGIEPKEDNKINNKKIIQTLATEEKLLYDCMSLEPISIDELIIKTGKEINEILCILTMLEIKGAIKKISGQKYIRV